MTGLDDKPNIIMSFQHLTHLTLKYVIQIVNEGDMKHLKKIIQKTSNHIHLYMVDHGLVEETQNVQYNPTNRYVISGNRSNEGRGSNSRIRKSSA